MAEKKVITTTTSTTEPNEPLDRAKGFWDKYSKPIIIIGSTIILLIAAWYAYQNFVVLPKEKNASEAIFPAESLFDKMAATGFNKDSSVIVINGGNLEGSNITGLLNIIKKYGGTKAANRAHYMAGATYLHLKDFPKAIKHLKEFDANGAHQVESKAHLMLGHAYAEQNKSAEALEHYRKAAGTNEKDEALTGDALLIAAGYAEASGKTDAAIELYKKLRDTYPAYAAVKSGDVDKYLARLGILK